MFTMIQNPGVAPVEGFTLLGVSTTRDCGVDGTIGQFGSGNKHAINVLLRAGLKVVVYCGKTKLEFVTRDDEIDDGLVRKPVKRVVCKMGGTSTRTIDLGWVLDFGAIDWTEVAMALREFISNAIDRTIREENGEFIGAIQDGRLAVDEVSDEKVKARDGYTRVFVECDDAVRAYVAELPKRFLHFSNKPGQVKMALLPKADRNMNGKRTAVIYREGVFVREIAETDEASVYDYNFKASELAIDESRNSNEYYIKAAVARLYKRATAAELYHVFKSLVDGNRVYEERLDPDYIISSWDTPKPEQARQWQQAWESVAGDAVLCGPSETIAEYVGRKGYKAVSLPSQNLVDAAGRFGVITDCKVLTDTEQKGHVKIPATPVAQAAVDTIWNMLVRLEMTNGKDKPEVGCFRDIMNAGSRILGFKDETGVYFAEDHASGDSPTKMVLKTALEEITHWVTGAGDNWRDFQDFVLRLVVELSV